MSQHTEGPWLVRETGTSSGKWPEIYIAGPFYDDGSELIAELDRKHKSVRESK